MEKSQRKTEQNATNAVRDYIDATRRLRSYIRDNDRTPLWDGHIFVYVGDPDKNDNLVGVVKAQVKGKTVETFSSTESRNLSMMEVERYMKNGGLVYFVVEIDENDYLNRRIFYKVLNPLTLKILKEQNKGQKEINIELHLLPKETQVFEDDMYVFLSDQEKQQSFINKRSLTLKEAIKDKNWKLKVECDLGSDLENLGMSLSSRPLTIYKEEEYADIPISDAELLTTPIYHYKAKIEVGGMHFYDEYTIKYEKDTYTYNFNDCLKFTHPKACDGKKRTVIEICYPTKGTLTEIIHDLKFLQALIEHNEMVIDGQRISLKFEEKDKRAIYSGLDHNMCIYRDIQQMWQEMHIPEEMHMEDFSEEEFQKLLNLVYYVYRKNPGQPRGANAERRPFFEGLVIGKLYLLILHKPIDGSVKWESFDGFSIQYVNIPQYPDPVPTLHYALLYSPNIMIDNVDYDSQLSTYLEFASRNADNIALVQSDIACMQNLLRHTEGQKKILLERFLKSLEDGVKE